MARTTLYVGLAAVIGLVANLAITAFAFAEEQVNVPQPPPKNLVILIWTDCKSYDATDVSHFAAAMKQEWQINLLHTCIAPDHPLKERPDYRAWQKELGISQYMTMFVTNDTASLFASSLYDGYTFPEMKMGFYKAQYQHDYYLFSHEILHLNLYEQSNANFVCWSEDVHSHYYDLRPSEHAMIHVDVGNGWTKGYDLLKHFDC